MKAKAYRVLFPEDEPTIREVLSEYMKMSGYQATETARGGHALLRLAERQLRHCRTGYYGAEAFNLYADDYIIAPVSPTILLKRTEMILRRTAGRPLKAAEEKRGLYPEESSYSAYYAGEKLPLTLSEYPLLKTLYQSPSRIFTGFELRTGLPY